MYCTAGSFNRLIHILHPRPYRGRLLRLRLVETLSFPDATPSEEPPAQGQSISAAEVLQLCSRADGRDRLSAIQLVAANKPTMKRCRRTAIPPGALWRAWPLRIMWIAS
jgi:hypothetical protein